MTRVRDEGYEQRARLANQFGLAQRVGVLSLALWDVGAVQDR